MRIIPTVRFTREELTSLREALLPYGLLDSYDASEDIVDDASKVHRALSSGSAWTEDQVRRAESTLQELSKLLLNLVGAKPHPDWVQGAKKAQKQGLLPFILDPEKTLEDMAEVRSRQLVACNHGLLIIDEALSLIDRVHQSIDSRRK